MAHKIKRQVYKLIFEADDLFEAGAVVRCRSATIGEYLDIVGLLDVNDNGAFRVTPKMMSGLTTRFIKVLREWDLCDEDGTPIPPTEAGFLSLELGHARVLVMAWAETVGGVHRPLEQPSSGGEQSEEVSIPMETLSENLQSLPVPN